METKSITDYVQSLHDIIPAVQMGLLPDGVGTVYHKFSESDHITTVPSIMSSSLNQDPFNYLGAQLYISSSSALDTVSIYLEGVDMDGRIAGESIITNGTAAIPLTTTFRTIFRGYNNNGIPLVGDIYVGSEQNPALGIPAINNTLSVITATYLLKSSNQTLTSVFTVPLGFTAFLTGWYGDAAKGKDITLVAYARQYGKIFRYQESMSNYQSSLYKPLPFMRFPEKTDFKVEASTEQGTQTGSCTYDILLLENDFLGKFRPLAWR
jgi:hypothetical protein